MNKLTFCSECITFIKIRLQDKLMKVLFMEKVMNPQKTYHYIGTRTIL